MQRLIAELLDESALTHSLSAAVACERASYIDAVQFIGSGQVLLAWFPRLSKPEAWFFQPLLLKNSREGAVYFSGLKAAAGRETYPMAMATQPNVEDLVGGHGLNSLLVAAILIPSLDRMILLDFRLRAHRRMAAIALAIRMYEIDKGHRPERLDELVSGYLDSIPRDPFAHGDEPIRYLPNAQPPLLYSVGPDGVDDGGRFTFRGLNNRGAVDPDKLDFVFFLNGDRPRAGS
ncbi:MAG: hypothetical protein GXP29_06895 [Planctomycetes bacterium]|nr:hypothetical protein [Planctomycetota bacterium]